MSRAFPHSAVNVAVHVWLGKPDTVCVSNDLPENEAEAAKAVESLDNLQLK